MLLAQEKIQDLKKNKMNKNTLKIFITFLIVFLLSNLIVAIYFIYSFSNLTSSITFKMVIKTIKQFSFVISIPTSILFVFIDALVRKIKTIWILYLTRCIVFFSLLFLISLCFSVYLITNALLDNPFIK